jgi:predicted DNA-binding ArsR family transcriptional regulator
MTVEVAIEQQYQSTRVFLEPGCAMWFLKAVLRRKSILELSGKRIEVST